MTAALSAIQSFERILIHNAIFFINTSTMFGETNVIGYQQKNFHQSGENPGTF